MPVESAVCDEAPLGADDAPRSRARRTGVTLLVAVVLFALVRAVLVQSFVIPSGSMEPTLQVGDRVLVTRYPYLFGASPRRGDVVVFNGSGIFNPAPAQSQSSLASAGRTVAKAFGVPAGDTDYVKRVIGVAGDQVVCCDAQGQITVNGTPLHETYIQAGDVPSSTRFDIVVPAGRIWVMGDHRSDSADSRAHMDQPGSGTVPVDRVVGRVTTVLWPLSRAGRVGRVPATTSASSAEGTG